MIKIVYVGLITEAFVYILFSAAPMAWLRSKIIFKTPFLYSNLKKQHMLECPVCTGFYICAFVFLFVVCWEVPALSAFFSFVLAYRIFTLLKDIFGCIFNFAMNLILWRTKE